MHMPPERHNSAAFRGVQGFKENNRRRKASQRDSNPPPEQLPARFFDHSVDLLVPTDTANLSYTLPPLPALEKFERPWQSDLVSTPPKHRRSTSSIYYAAAWGSPYATPSPKRSPEPENCPSKVASAGRTPGCYRSERGNWLSDDSGTIEERRRSAWIRGNHGESWLDLRSDEEEAALTPTLKDSVDYHKSSEHQNDLSHSFRRHHKGHDSVETVKQEEIDSASGSGNSRQTSVKMTMSGIEAESSMQDHQPLHHHDSERTPPESLVTKAGYPSQSDPPNISPRSKRRSSTSLRLSSQRPRKRAVWKGKICFIALPLDDERGRRPLLTPADIVARMQRWQKDGLDIHGFKLNGSPTSEEFCAQSCRIYPDPGNVREERERCQFRVSIPNQTDWDVYVNFLKEERLRALGVTLKDDGHQSNTPTHFSLSRSCTSLELPGQSLSPPVPLSSAASNTPLQIGPSFSPAFRSSSASSRVGSFTSSVPQYAHPPNGSHRSTRSSAHPALDLKVTSPFNLHARRQTPTFPRDSSPSAYLAQRLDRRTPPKDTNLQSLGRDVPLVPPFAEEFNHGQSNGSFARTTPQQGSQPKFVPNQQHRQSHTETAPFDHDSTIPKRSADEWEIAHPAPQSHQRNISEALQKEIDEVEEAARMSHHITNAHMTAAPLNGIKNIQVLGRSYSPQKGRECRGPNDLHLNEQPSNPPEAPGETDRGEDGEPKADTIKPGPKESQHITDHTAPVPQYKKQDLWMQRDNKLYGHRTKPSVSNLNVEAEEFRSKPSSQFPSSELTSAEDICQPSIPDAILSYKSHGPKGSILPKPSMGTGLNADAPSFTPSALGGSSFQFTSRASNVKASISNPKISIGEDALEHNMDSNCAGAAKKIATNPTPGRAVRREEVLKELPITQLNHEDQAKDIEDHQVRVSRQEPVCIQANFGDEISPYTTPIPLEDGAVSLVASGVASKSPKQATDGNEGAAGESSTGMSPMVVSRKGGQEMCVLDEHSAEQVRTLLKVQTVSSEHDLQIRREEKRAMIMPSPSEQTSAGDKLAQSGDSAGQPPGNYSAASASASLRGNANDDMFSDSSSVAAKPRKLVGLEDSGLAGTPASSPPTTSLRRALLPLGRTTEHSKSSLSSTAAEQGERESSYTGAHDERIGTTCDGMAPEAYQGKDEYIGQPSDGHLPKSSEAAEGNSTVPSYDEIDAIMKQFEDNPDLGIERVGTPTMRPRPAARLFLNPSINIRSDAPTPSYAQTQVRPEPMHRATGSGKPQDQARSGMSMEPEVLSIDRTGGSGNSDRNDAFLPASANEFKATTQFFDTHVQSTVRAVLEDRLGPLEKTLVSIQQSIALIKTQHDATHRGISNSDDLKHSDADDEDEDINLGEVVPYRTRSPIHQRKDRRTDIIKVAVMEALAAHKHESPPPKEMDHTAFEQVLSELKSLKDSPGLKQRPEEIRAVVDGVISTHPRLRGKRVQEDHEAGMSQKFQLQIDGLESMLKVANERAEEAYRARRAVEDDLAETERRLDVVVEEAAQYREASEEAERSLRIYYAERESVQGLQQINSELSLKNAALETTLEQYRLSHDQWRNDMEDEQQRNKDLNVLLEALRREIEESSQTKQGLRAKLERLQDDMSDVMERFALDQASWFRKEHELSAKNKEIDGELRRETKLRQKLELEMNELVQEQKEVSKYRTAYETTQKENTRLEALLAETRQDNRAYEDAAHRFAREIDHLREVAETAASKAQSTYEHDIRSLNSRHDSVTADLEGQISRLQVQLQQTRDDAEKFRTQYQLQLNEHIDRHARTLHEVNETKEEALAEQRRSHEKALNDLRERHARALHNASDDKHRLESHLMEKLTLSSDKIQHLEGKVTDLQERLEITSSAARAAAAAAAGKCASKSDIHPVTSSTAASMPIGREDGIPEKISPQALRESIMVLQDQLQNREQTIESLEAELAEVDRDAPKKMKERETEITWLRELLGLRIDDLEEIIDALSGVEFEREAVKDAVIRLRANLQMEQQEKERGLQSKSGVLPSMASLSSIAQTPRALPMAAAAAWGNWRRARDTTHGSLSGPANTHDQTPTRSSVSPQSFLSGLLTPPRTSQRQVTPPLGNVPATMVPPHGRRSSSVARPLRAYSSQARSISGTQAGRIGLGRQQSSEHVHPIAQRRERDQEAPSTPPMTRKSSYVGDTDARRSIMSDVDDDASAVGSGMDGGDSSLEEPFEKEAR